MVYPILLLFAGTLMYTVQVLSAGTGYQPSPSHDPYPAGGARPVPTCKGVQ